MIAAVMGVWALMLIVIALRWPQHLVHAAIVCSVFEGAAIINAGGLGIAPYYFALMLIAVHCVFVRTSTANFLGYTPTVRRVMSCAGLLLVIGLGSAVVMPRVFVGWPVLSPRLSADAQAPLEFSTSNVGQAVYLMLNVLMLWYTAQTCRSPAAARGMVKAFMIAGVIVVGLAVYQLASSLTGLPFPDDLLYSNDAFVMQHGTAILDMPRICSTFTEPSSLAVFLISFIAFLIAGLEVGIGGWRVVLLLLTALGALVLSTSSTAYIGLAAIAACAIGRYIFLPVFKGRGSMKAALAITAVLIAAACTFIVNDQLRDVVQKTVFEKDQSASYAERSEADSYSISLAERTWGLGVGLGSNRASSFLPSVLSTIGICGAAALAALLFQMVRSQGIHGDANQLHRPMAAALIAVVVAKMISSPDMATPGMWAAMAGLISIRAMSQEQSQASTPVITTGTPDEPSPQQPSLSFG